MEKPDLLIATAQLENISNDKSQNLAIIRRLAVQAKSNGAHVVAFHECSITGYTFASKLTRDQLLAVAETLSPPGPSVQSLCHIAREIGIIIPAGLFEKEPPPPNNPQEEEQKIYNTYICASAAGHVLASFRKLHPFISPHLSPGQSYVIFNLTPHWKASMLICYDNNTDENVRATALLGAEILFMPHVTMVYAPPAPWSRIRLPQSLALP